MAPPAEDGTATKAPSYLKAHLASDVRVPLVDSLLGLTTADEGTFLAQAKRAFQRHGLQRHGVTITYQDVRVDTHADVGTAAVATVANVPINFVKDLWRDFTGVQNERQPLSILDGVSGVLKPGRLTLLLGPPACGKSTLLKLLGGRLKSTKDTKVSGTVRYNGADLDSFHVQRTSAYVDQHDAHMAYLTVEETLQFAFDCLAGLHGLDHSFADKLREAAASHIAGDAEGGKGMDKQEVRLEETLAQILDTDAKVEVMMRVFGMAHARDTYVGDAMVRGVSGGEKKRLTTVEMLMGPRKVLLMDEISTGLDSATLYTITKFLSEATHALEFTVLISLKQPQPETYMLFDDVLLFSEGRVVYHGPVPDVLPFLSTLGFMCPTRKDVPSFLLEVMTPSGQHAYHSSSLRHPSVEGTGSRQASEMLVPLEEMARHFWEESAQGQAMAEALAEGVPQKARHPDALVHSHFALTYPEAIGMASRRQLMIMMRDKILLRGRVAQVVVLGLITGSLFYKLEKTAEDGLSFYGASFMATLLLAFGGFAQLPFVIEMKRVWHKQRDSYFIPATAQGLAIALTQLPITLIECTLFSLIFYFMVGFYMSAGYFFTFYVTLIATSLAISAVFRLVAFMSPDMVVTNTFASLCILLFILTSGFVIVRDSIPHWLIWVYYLSPFAYSIRCIVINEFTSPDWQVPTSQPGVTLGDAMLNALSFYKGRVWIWGGVGYLFGIYVLATIGSIISLAYQDAPVQRAKVPDKDEICAAAAAANELRRKIIDRKNTQSKAGAAQGGVATEAAGVNGTAAAANAASAGDTTAKAASAIGSVASSLPFQTVTLVFRDIRYSVPNPNFSRAAVKAVAAATAKGEAAEAGVVRAAGKMLTLLDGVTGYIKPGVLTALMGGSGAGKTTLMDVVAGRKTVGRIEGDIFVNGRPKEQASWSRVMGYCEQNDIHSPAVTVIEAFMFSARLRLPASVSDDRVLAYVYEVLDIVDMTDIMHNSVGMPGESGLSVEQRKRLTIGVELVSNPSAIFMDEPTSGLDASAAKIVMSAVRAVANNGRTVCVTIHQPSIEIFEAFDMLLLIQKGGRITYFGPVGTHSEDLIRFLSKEPSTPALPGGYNPATWMLEVTGGSMATMVQTVDIDWPSRYAESELYAGLRTAIEALIAEDIAKHAPLVVQSTYAQPFGQQCRLLLHKYNLAFWRSPSYNLVRLASTLVAAVLYGLMYLNRAAITNPSSVGNIQNIMGLMFSSCNMLGMTNLMSSMAVVNTERIIFYRERAASMYDPFAYGIALAVVELPYLILQTIIFCVILYWMAAFKATAEAFFFYLIMFFETMAFYTIFGQFMVWMTPGPGVAQVIAAVFNFLFNIFNGFIITYSSMPEGWRWMNRISPTTWILYGLGVSQTGDSDALVVIPGQTQPLTVSEYVKQYFGYDYNFRWYCVLIMAAYVVFVRVTSILALKYLSFLKR
ncbi:hypothetical protein FOA52_010286 [Chlamydomonas sp. UWO 241]|nr:hypothetical protein FOA52_010286 [Chlamydomonas sp. UWO 241]